MRLFTKKTKNQKRSSQNHHSKNKKQFAKMTTSPMKEISF
ncbi:hypothetical protein D083_3052 [Dickeya solani RNS 08.23.3.1.A]|nr:hypothetical protein D083_3052 [Dickeya solani RNS 08.23.3.1.A]